MTKRTERATREDGLLAAAGTLARHAWRAFTIAAIVAGVVLGGGDGVRAEETGGVSGGATGSQSGPTVVAKGPRKVILKVEFAHGVGAAVDGEFQISVISGTYEEDNSSTPTVLVEIDLPAGVSIYENYGQQYLQYDGAQAIPITGRPLFPGSVTDSMNSSVTGGGNLGFSSLWPSVSAQLGQSKSTMQGKEAPSWLGEELRRQGIISGFTFLLTPNGEKSALMFNDLFDQKDVSFGAPSQGTIASAMKKASEVYLEYALTYLGFQKQRYNQRLEQFDPSLRATPERKSNAVKTVDKAVQARRQEEKRRLQAHIEGRLDGAQYN